MEAQLRDDPPWYLEVGENFTEAAAERTMAKISQDLVKNGEAAGFIATMGSLVPIVGQIVAIAATCVSIVQMIKSQKQIANLQAYIRTSADLNALWQGELAEEELAGSIELSQLRDELDYVRAVQGAYRRTIFISAGLCLTAITILIIRANKK